MVELVDDHDVEVIRSQRVELGGVQALDRGEDVVESGRARSTHPLLAERGIAQRVAERGQALVEDLLAMGNEQQAGPPQPLTERPVVQCRHDRLAGTGRGDEQVAVMPPLARQLEQLQQPFLERVRTQLDRAQNHVWAGVSPSGAGPLVVELGRVVGHEVAAGPVALEDRGELGDHVGVAGRRHPDVPLQACDLGRVGEVRRADVGGREAGLPVEHPGFGMEACRARVVGDPNAGAEVDELIDGRALGRIGVRRGEHP